MIVAVDARALVGNRTGIGVHTAEIASRLRRSQPVLLTHVAIEDRSGIENVSMMTRRFSPGVAWQQFLLSRFACQADADVLWAPHGTLPWNLRMPSVSSIHDFTSIKMPLRHRLRTILSFNPLIRRSLEQATRIAAVSRYTADEAIRDFGVAAAKIEVVPNGVDYEFFSSGAATQPLSPPYLLFAGTFEPRKGLSTLFTAWKAMRDRPRLILAGDEGWRENRLRKDMTSFIARGQIETAGFVSRERLRELYQGAAAFVYPAEGEGFGLPPLEAMAAGTPVIACRSGAVPEVVGEAAILVSPGDHAALKSSLEEIIRSNSLRAELTSLGAARARRFSWMTSAQQMDELFHVAVAHA